VMAFDTREKAFEWLVGAGGEQNEVSLD